MTRIYYSGDLEASGPVAPIYSMLSVGFCIVGNLEETFYAELKPISDAYDTQAMRIGAKGLSFLSWHKDDPRFDTEGEQFDPTAVLAELQRYGDEPADAMRRLAAWVKSTAKAHRGTPRALYAPASFESSFLPYYFHKFAGENPLGHSAEDANSYLHGALGQEDAHLAMFGLRPKDGLTHHALEDAIVQAREFEQARRLGSENRIKRGLRRPHPF